MKELIKKSEQSLRKAYSAWYKSRFHMREKNFDGIRAFTEEEKTCLKDFWEPYHCRFNLKFLQYYCGLCGFDPCYLPDDLWYNRILPYYNDKVLAQKIDDKCLYDIFLNRFTMPRTVLRLIAGRIYDKDYNMVDEETAEKIAAQYDQVIVKPAINSCGGAGIQKLSGKELRDFVTFRKAYPDAIIQEVLEQHEDLRRLNPTSLNTIRISSLILNDGTVILLAAFLRMGSGESVVDNVCSGGVFVGVDIPSGTLKKFGYTRKTGKYVKLEAHPDSQVRFEGYKIPSFDKIVEQVRQNAKYLPRTRLLGWDVSIDQNGEPVMIEVNIEEHELEVVQLANGPYFGNRDLTTRVLREVFGMD